MATTRNRYRLAASQPLRPTVRRLGTSDQTYLGKPIVEVARAEKLSNRLASDWDGFSSMSPYKQFALDGTV